MKHHKCVFLLPEYNEKPIGGYKVVYEYANRLVRDGNDVTIVYPSFLFFWKSPLRRKLKMLYFFVYYCFNDKKGVGSWFSLDERVQHRKVWMLHESMIPQADIYVATAIETAYYLNRWKTRANSNKFYLVQAFEDWDWGRDFVLKTWRYPMHKIVISEWLAGIARNLGESYTLIENGVDREGLFSYIPYEEKKPMQVAMLYHKQPLKGCKDGLRALERVREKYPELRSVWFGSAPKPKELPSWVSYYQQPSIEELNRIYNESAVYLAPSHSEGFGLTVGEAMVCGCAVVCTNTGGFLTMATDQWNALVVPVKDVERMSDAIIKLIEQPNVRFFIAQNGHRAIQRFTWDVAYNKFEKVLSNHSHK